MTQIISLSKIYDLRSTISGTVVLATGVFDLLHQEHTNFLRAASVAGDILLVGLESDARVRALKGPGRPVNPLAIRLRRLAKLNLADYVFQLPSLSTQPQREKFIAQLRPHILAVSSHTPNLPNKRRIMKLVNGRVKIVHRHNPAISTTQLLRATLS